MINRISCRNIVLDAPAYSAAKAEHSGQFG
jgi:hypothetical protein